MHTNNMTPEKRRIFQFISWKILVTVILLPLAMNVISLMINLAHFNTFEGARDEELLADILFYIGNWPTILMRTYPHGVTAKGEIVYDGSGWLTPKIFIINFVGWIFIGFIISITARQSKRVRRRVNE